MARVAVLISIIYFISTGLLKAQGSVFPSTTASSPRSNQTESTNQSLLQREHTRITTRQQALNELREDLSASRAEVARQQFKIVNQALYKRTLAELTTMLATSHVPSVKQAVYMVENTFLNGAISYQDFNDRVQYLTKLCRYLAADSLHPDLNARFLALHRLMTDTIHVKLSLGTEKSHFPPHYDFEDYQGLDDHTKNFVHRLLLSNTGQCHSMPLLYKILADELGIKAYLSMAPNHSYIQVRDKKGTLYSYETTNGHFVTDAYYMASGYIKASALKHRAYLDTLTRRETVACSVFDLAHGYIFRYGYDDFVEQCVQLGLRNYPHSVEGRMLAHDIAFVRFRDAWQVAGRPTQTQARQLPTLRPLLEEVEQRTKAIDEIGYEEMPVAQYQRWLEQVQEEKARQMSEKSTRQFGQIKD